MNDNVSMQNNEIEDDENDEVDEEENTDNDAIFQMIFDNSKLQMNVFVIMLMRRILEKWNIMS